MKDIRGDWLAKSVGGKREVMDNQSPVGLIGLGLMGTALAGRFVGAGRSVVGFDKDPARCRELDRIGGKAADSSAEIARNCRTIVLSLPTSDVVERVVAEMEPHLTESTIVVDTTTGDPDRVEKLGRGLADRGVGYLEATVSGSSAETARGEVVVLAGGPHALFESCQDLLRCFARQSFHLGNWGSGTRMKLVTNLILGLNRAALAEGLAFAEHLGLDPPTALTILSTSAACSRVMETKGRKMIERDFTPQGRLSQHLKDVRLILAQSARHGATAPLTEVHQGLLERLEASGLGDQDNSAVIEAFRAPPEAGQVGRQPVPGKQPT